MLLPCSIHRLREENLEKIICALCNTAVEVTVLSSHLLTNHGWKMVPHLAKPVAEAPV